MRRCFSGGIALTPSGRVLLGESECWPSTRDVSGLRPQDASCRAVPDAAHFPATSLFTSPFGRIRVSAAETANRTVPTRGATPLRHGVAPRGRRTRTTTSRLVDGPPQGERRAGIFTQAGVGWLGDAWKIKSRLHQRAVEPTRRSWSCWLRSSLSVLTWHLGRSPLAIRRDDRFAAPVPGLS